MTWTSNPAAPRQTVTEYVPATADDARAAVLAARAGAAHWAARPAGQRALLLTRAADELESRASELALLVTREEGKTLAAATGEVAKTVEQFRFASQLAYQVDGATYAPEALGTFAYTLRVPLGVVVAITPWNFPLSLAARKIAPALAAGNSVLLKPSPVTAGAGAALVDACLAAGIPQDVLTLIQGDDVAAMTALTGSSDVAAVSFTGSDGVGELLRRSVTPRARLQFELGGHNAAIVCADADLQAAARLVASGAFELTGQACTATDRVLVARSVQDEFIELLVKQVGRHVVGPGEDTSTTIGPVATTAQHQRLTALLESATAAGTVLAQTELPEGLDADGLWIAPTLLADVPDDHALNTGEIFGPLLSVVAFEDFEEALARVNASAHGLVTAVHTRDLATAHTFAARAACGIVKVNERTTGNGLAAPFGGWKQSSSGAFPEGGRGALEFVTDTKTVYLGYDG